MIHQAMLQRLYKKIKVPWISLLFFTAMALAGYGKAMLQIFLLITFHESFHIAAASWLKHDISQIVVYPFGLGMSLKQLEYRHSIEELMIAMAGLISYLFSSPFIDLLFLLGWISEVNKAWMHHINTSILLFNALPMYPLDGGRIVHALIHQFFTYKQAKQITIVLSLVVLVVLMWWQTLSLSMFPVVLLFLLMQLILTLKQLPRDQYHFFLFRYLHPQSYRKKKHKHSDLYRNHWNMIETNYIVQEEDTWLHQQLLFRNPKGKLRQSKKHAPECD